MNNQLKQLKAEQVAIARKAHNQAMAHAAIKRAATAAFTELLRIGTTTERVTLKDKKALWAMAQLGGLSVITTYNRPSMRHEFIDLYVSAAYKKPDDMPEWIRGNMNPKHCSEVEGQPAEHETALGYIAAMREMCADCRITAAAKEEPF